MLNIPDETAILSPQVIGLDKIDKSFNVADIPRRSVRPDEAVVYAAPHRNHSGMGEKET